MRILDIFRKPAKTADDLRKKLAQISAQLPALETVLKAVEAERSDALLRLGDKEIERIEGRVALARRDLDRARAASETVERQLAEAEEREKVERLNDIRREAETLAKETAAGLRSVYLEAGARLVEALEAAARVDERIAEANWHLKEAGITDRIETVNELTKLKSGVGLVLSLFDATSLAPLNSRGWGAARQQAQRIGNLNSAAEDRPAVA